MARPARVFGYFFIASWCIVAFFGGVKAAQAATMQFSPTSGTYSTGTTFPVQVKVDTVAVDTTSADAVVKFDATLLSVDSVSYGSFYPTVLHSQQSGKLYISGMVSSPGTVINGSGVLATINFKPLSAGTATVSFDCTAGQTNDSNVTKNDTNATDILDCSTLAYATYTLSGTTVASPTPSGGVTTSTTPSPTTAAGTTVPTPVTTQIPSAGIMDIVPLLPKLMMGVLFLIIGLVPLMI